MATRWLRVAEVALLCRVKPSTVRTWIQRGHVEVNARGRVDGASVLRYLDERGDRGQRRGGPR